MAKVSIFDQNFEVLIFDRNFDFFFRKLCLNTILSTPLHTASLLGDDGIIRVLLSHGADASLVDSQLDSPVHLAARWCSREENYPNYKLVMTPLFKAAPKIAYAENKKGETPQMLLNIGKEREHFLKMTNSQIYF